MSGDNEPNLVRAAQAGDRAAMGQLLLNHYDDLTRFLTPKVTAAAQRHVSVDDVLQQSFAKAFQDIKRFEYLGEGSVYAWLRRISERRLQDVLRGLGRKKRGGDRRRVDVSSSMSMVDLFDMLSDGQPTASRVAKLHEAEQAVHVALAELPEDYRQVIQLRFLQGLGLTETSSKMGKTEASVRALTDRAKKKLREAIGRLSAYLSR